VEKMAHRPSSEEAGGGQAVNDAAERDISSCLSSHDQRVSEEASPPSAAEQISRGSISARLKRNSSKLLSLLGLRNSSNGTLLRHKRLETG
jgi:hypothetical protein